MVHLYCFGCGLFHLFHTLCNVLDFILFYLAALLAYGSLALCSLPRILLLCENVVINCTVKGFDSTSLHCYFNQLIPLVFVWIAN